MCCLRRSQQRLAQVGFEARGPEDAGGICRGSDERRGTDSGAPPRLVEDAFMGEPELERADGILAELPVQPLEEDQSRRVELVAPAVVLHENVQGPAAEERGLRPRRDLSSDGALPELRTHAARQPPRHARLPQRPVQDAGELFRPSAGRELRHLRLRRRASRMAATISSIT